jgi:hypothetical protein
MDMTVRRLGLLLVVLLPLAMSANAQPAQPAHPDPAVARAAAVRVLDTFSRCIAESWPDRAAAILALDFQTEEFRRRVRAFAQGVEDCAPDGMLAFSALPFAGIMAEALLPRRLAGRDLATAVAFDPARPPLVARNETELVGLCVVRTDPAKAAALLASLPHTAEENAAFGVLMPEVSGCLAAGARLRVDRLGLRAVLALAAYRLADNSTTPRPPAH